MGIIKMATFSKKIIFEVATATALHLLNKKNLHNKLKVGELVYIPDRLLRKHPNSIRDALGKIIEVASSTRDYLIQTLDGDIMKRHYSDLINANTTKNQGEVMLIDPFQIIDVKNMIVPEALYPRFKLQLDKFGNDSNEASLYEPDEPNEVDADEADNLPTGNDRLSKALNAANPSKTDKIIKRMLQSDEQEDVEIPEDLRNIKNPPQKKKKKKKKKKS